MRLTVQWNPAPCWNRSSASPAWGSTAEAARPCSAPTEMGLAPAIPWEPAEVGSPVSAAHCNCKGMERGPWTWCRSRCTSRSQLCSRVRLCTFLQDDFNCNLKEKYTLFQKNTSEFLKSWLINVSYMRQTYRLEQNHLWHLAKISTSDQVMKNSQAEENPLDFSRSKHWYLLEIPGSTQLWYV